ncbi:Forkhead box protein H1 [Dissostichus eleginoides]|uniref:Forkhead box protein H1 n=1 Tax=Dissostichus eleginoides TaxID=100907 RepID=A0AAD9ESZ2_DISEL|nr:Forkhead box protein H1 [Dissostichus eleginoides]
MQTRPEKFGSLSSLASSSQRGLFRKSTYLAKIAVILQDVPGKMLTFTQLMYRLAPLMSDDKRAVENNIRVCLSTNPCFVKIPVVPDSLDSKRNYWKLDSGQITAKMARRHFKGILQLFPELASKVETENLIEDRGSRNCSAVPSPEPAACRGVQIRCEVKFSSPFSIESLLKRDSPSARASRASPLSSVPLKVDYQQRRSIQKVWNKKSFNWDSEEPLFLQASAGSSQICSTGGSTHCGLTASGAAKPIRMHVCTESSFPVYTRARAAPYFSSPHSSYITYSVPTFTQDALWL